MTYEELEKVNRELEPMVLERKTKDGKIVKKNYAEVKERVKAFRKLFPMGRIETAVIDLSDAEVTMKASIYAGDMLLSTAYANEAKNASSINRTSYIENCETSAVGRALGFVGIGIDAAIASADEVTGAEIQQDRIRTQEEADTLIDEKHFKALKARFNEAGIRMADVLSYYGLERPTQITYGLERIINSDFKSLVKELGNG